MKPCWMCLKSVGWPMSLLLHLLLVVATSGVLCGEGEGRKEDGSYYSPI